MLTNQFYISVRMGNMQRVVPMGTSEFEKCIKRYVLNTVSLRNSELEYLKGILTVMGLLDQFVYADSGYIFIKYGNVPDCDFDYD